jgi:hypothetical protein
VYILLKNKTTPFNRSNRIEPSAQVNLRIILPTKLSTTLLAKNRNKVAPCHSLRPRQAFDDQTIGVFEARDKNWGESRKT